MGSGLSFRSKEKNDTNELRDGSAEEFFNVREAPIITKRSHSSSSVVRTIVDNHEIPKRKSSADHQKREHKAVSGDQSPTKGRLAHNDSNKIVLNLREQSPTRIITNLFKHHCYTPSSPIKSCFPIVRTENIYSVICEYYHYQLRNLIEVSPMNPNLIYVYNSRGISRYNLENETTENLNKSSYSVAVLKGYYAVAISINTIQVVSESDQKNAIELNQPTIPGYSQPNHVKLQMINDVLYLITSWNGGGVVIYDTVSQKQIFSVKNNDNYNCSCFSPNGKYLLSVVDHSRYVYLIQFEGESNIFSKYHEQKLTVFEKPVDSMGCDWHPNSTYFACAGASEVIIYSMLSNQVTMRISNSIVLCGDPFRNVKFCPDPSKPILVVLTDASTAAVVDRSTEMIEVLSVGKNITGASFDPHNPATLFIGCSTGIHKYSIEDTTTLTKLCIAYIYRNRHLKDHLGWNFELLPLELREYFK